MSIFKKLLILVSATIVCIVLTLCCMGYFLISGMGDNLARSQLVVHSNIVQNEIESIMQTQSGMGDVLQRDRQFAAALAAGDVETLRDAVRELIAFPTIDLVTVSDAQGRVLLRGHSSEAGDILPASRASAAVARTTGKTAAGMEMDSSGRLTLAVGVPILYSDNIVGVVILGMDMASGDFVRKMKELLNTECTIFVGDTRVSTTVMNQGKPAVGTRLNNDSIYRRVIGGGEKVLTRNMILGAEYDTVYWPWKDISGKNAGMFFVGLSRASIESSQIKVVLYFVLAGVLVGGIMLALGVVVARAIVRPLSAATRFAERVAGGDLGQTLAITTKDEVGTLSRALGVMVATLKTMLRETAEKSHEAEEQAQKALAAVKEADAAKEKAEADHQAMVRAAEDVEHVVARLMVAVDNINKQVDTSNNLVTFQHDRVGSSTIAMEAMNTTVLEVAKNASWAAESSERAMEKAKEGESIVSESIESINHVQRDTLSLRETMEKLVAQAQSIGTIIVIINDIADQTNLLALNAAIEAARAGEAGRGFAVVADEVRKLAEKTMNATKEVNSAVTSIQGGAQGSMEAVALTSQNLESTIDLVARSGKALREIVAESTTIADQTRSIATASEEQTASSEEITHSLEEINSSASDTASAMQSSADATSELAGQIQELQNLVRNLRSGD